MLIVIRSLKNAGGVVQHKDLLHKVLEILVIKISVCDMFILIDSYPHFKRGVDQCLHYIDAI